MTDKELLLKDLCARLPCGVFVKDTYNGHYGRMYKISQGRIYYVSELNCNYLEGQPHYIEPYLRPMSDMTKEERMILLKYGSVGMDENDKVFDVYPFGMERNMAVVDFLNEHHFDYRGLIEKGLALEAPEVMYK